MADNLTKKINAQKQDNKQIIEEESQKFMEIFNRVFSENKNEKENENENEIESSNLDSEDGIIEDILIAIVKKVKTLIKQKFVNEVLLNENGENESGSETET